MTTQLPNWNESTPPTPRKKRKTGRIVCAVIGLGIGGIVAIGVGSSGGGNDSTAVTPAPAVTQHQAPNERADLATFVLDDRSAYGMSDVWIKYTLINHSSKTSDYVIKWEAVDSKGTRVDNGEVYAYDVRPGQTAHGEDTTMLTNGQNKVNITSFDRTEAY